MFAAAGQDPKRRDLHLTLDRNIQYVTEKELEEAVQESRLRVELPSSWMRIPVKS